MDGFEYVEVLCPVVPFEITHDERWGGAHRHRRQGRQRPGRGLAVDWLFLGQLTLRALVLAVLLALVIAAWEEQKENAPAQALLGIVGALGFWYYEVDQAIWKRIT